MGGSTEYFIRSGMVHLGLSSRSKVGVGGLGLKNIVCLGSFT